MFPQSSLEVAAVTNNYERYLPDPRTYNAAMHLGHMAAYREALRYAYGRQVLDLGCGVGYGSFFLASYGAAGVTAVDLNLMAVRYAQQHYAHPRLYYQQADASFLPFADQVFDFVFSSQVIEHVPSVAVFLREVARVLKPDGLCLFTTPNHQLFAENEATTNPHHLSEMGWELYQTLARQVFPGARFRGIPQRCLVRNSADQLELKPNSLIRPADYVVQDQDLAECENMLCYGRFDPAAPLATTLPAALQPVSEELRPFFWEATTRRWLLLGLYPAEEGLSATMLPVGASVTQAFTLPAAALCGVEVDWAEPVAARCHVRLQGVTPTGPILVDQEVQVTGCMLSIACPADPWPVGTSLVLTIAVLSVEQKPPPGSGGVALKLTRSSALPPAQCGHDALAGALALRTFHAVLPPIVAA